MSWSDDFHEALRRVKRNFSGNSEYTGPNEPAVPTPNAAEATGQPIEQPPAIDPAVEHIPAAESPQSPQADAGTGMGDAEVMSAFEQASAIPPASAGSDMDMDAYLDEEEIPSASGVPFSNYTPPTHDESRMDGRRIFDFDDNDIYGDEKTVISKNTVIRGALQTEDSVRLLGQVMGDIDCKSNIVVAGKVRGNTSASNAYIYNAQVDGDVHCDDVITISNDAWILGNIQAQQAEVDGKIKGNIQSRHVVSIGSSSSVLGDISTDELEIKRGAFINGQIMMYSPSRDVLDRFDQFED